jgi:cell division protein FtsQ
MRQQRNDTSKGANRSEEVRQRREQRTQQRTSSVSSRSVKPVRSKPVTVRGGTFGTPIHQSAGTRRARRQFYVAMDQVGTELRLPAMPVLRPGWRLLSSLIAIMAILSIYSMWTSPFLQVINVQVEGLERISGEEIVAAANLGNLAIIEVDPRAVEEKLSKSFPDLVDVKIGVTLPNYVTLSAIERQPVVIWYKGDNAHWLDADGVIFPPRGEAGPLLIIESEDDLPAAPLPIEELTRHLDSQIAETPDDNAGFLGLFMPKSKEKEPEPLVIEKNIDPAFIRTVQDLSQKLPPETTLIYHPFNGLGWYDEQGWQVYIGRDLSTFEAKYTMYEGISRYLNDNGLRPALVSVEHLDAPFYRLEQ